MFKSIALLLLISPLLVACSPPPDITADSREVAFERCFAGLDEEMAEIQADPSQRKLFESDEFETVTILKTYCKPAQNRKHDDYWSVYGYVEYLRQPTDKYPGDSKVEQVVVFYGDTWKQ